MKRLVLLSMLLSYFVVASAQSKIESPEDLKNWLPSAINGYTAGADSYAAELQQDGSPYFMVAKKYTKGGNTISIVVLDYRKSSTRISNITSNWNPDKQSDDAALYSANTLIAGCKAQELVDKTKKTSQIYLYHADRYLVTISSPSEDITFLKTLATGLALSNLTN